MRDLRRYWSEIRALEAALTEFLWIVDAVGHVIEVSARVAAPLLQAKSHRVATEEEISAHVARTIASNRDAARERMLQRGAAVVAIPERNSKQRRGATEE
jgi:hypothetical protein